MSNIIEHHKGIRDQKKRERSELKRKLSQDIKKKTQWHDRCQNLGQVCNKKRNSLQKLDQIRISGINKRDNWQKSVDRHKQILTSEKRKNSDLKDSTQKKKKKNQKQLLQIRLIQSQKNKLQDQIIHYKNLNDSVQKRIQQEQVIFQSQKKKIENQLNRKKLLEALSKASNSDQRYQAEQQLLISLKKQKISQIQYYLDKLNDFQKQIDIIGQYVQTVQSQDKIRTQIKNLKSVQEIKEFIKTSQTSSKRLKFDPVQRYQRLGQICQTLINLSKDVQDEQLQQEMKMKIQQKISFIMHFFSNQHSNPSFIPSILQLNQIPDKSGKQSNPEQLGRSITELLQQLKLQSKQLLQIRNIYNGFQFNCNRFKTLSKQGIKLEAEKLNLKSRLKTQLSVLLALMNRANKIVDGYELRPAQILTVIIFFTQNTKTNRACEVKTGEGKTTIISLIAVIQFLKGRFVDVITSNQVLAADAVDLKSGRTSFYALFGISATHNNPDPDYITGPRECYSSHVVYGTIGSFQFDYLKHRYELKQTKGSRRQSSVIIDEADNVILDNAAHTAKLSEPLSGLAYLKNVYFHIWTELIKIEGELQLESKQTEEITDQNKKAITKKLKQIQFDQDVPAFLKSYCHRKKQIWIQSAISARYDLHNKVDYIISKKQQNKDDPQVQQTIIPLDNLVGTTLQNTKLTHLHPFLQLKHNLQLQEDGLSSIFIANCEYINLYSKLFCLTGTLGCQRETKIFKEVYKTDCVIVPSFKKCLLEFEKCNVAKNREIWIRLICEDVKDKVVDYSRAVLVICSTVYDLEAISQQLKSQFPDLKLIQYKDERDSPIIQELNSAKVQEKKTVILSTNIGGRGTDLKLSEKVLKNKGLHVIVTFCACERIIRQAVGRAGRQGQPGTAKIIVQLSSLLKFNIQLGQCFEMREIFQALNFSSAKSGKNKQSAEDHQIMGKIKYIRQCHQYFLHFGAGYVQCKAKKMPRMVIQDLKAEWAFAFDSKEVDQLTKIFERVTKANGQGRSYVHQFLNPVYAVKHAEYILNSGLNSTNEDSNLQK